MTVARIPISKVICILITLTLTSSLALAAPAGRSSKPRKASAHSAKKSSKSKATARGSKATARARSGKAGKVARGVERGRGRRVVYARGRGRYKGGRYRKHYVVSRPASSHGSGVHKFLADAWTREQGTADGNAAASQELSTPSLTAVGPDSSHAVTGESAASPANDVAKPKQIDPTQTTEELPLNPLVAAYTESLAARGFAADNQGFIVTTLKGEVLAEHNADKLFNPASVTKIATSLTAISRLGPDFKFRTSLYTDGALDQSTGILRGSLYVIGSGDPAFFYENAMMIADKLNRAGIREVEGDLIVLGHFYFNFSTSLDNSAKALRNVLSSDTWNAAAKGAYPRFLAMRAAEDTNAQQSGARLAPISPGLPSLRIAGKTITSSTVNTTSLTPLAVHTSLPLLRVLKGLNDFSNNWMATVIGDLVGGTDAVERFLKMEVGFKEDEVQFATPSGLGANYISPRGTISMLKKLITYLDGKGLQLENILPVAGVDQGTLQRRFTDAFRGSVVAKTGTLSSVSALAGVAYTRQRGPLLFVIYNRGGSAHSFRAAQDETIKKLITLYGGPVPIRYTPSAGSRAPQRATEQNTQLLSSPAPRQ